MAPTLEPEYEAKFLDTEPATVRAAIRAAGPSHHRPLVLTRRRLFDFPDRRLHARGRWLRIRDDGTGATMAVKQRSRAGIDGIHEVEVTIGSFDTACRLLESLGLVAVAYQESRRESWQVGGAQVTLDEWPWLPPFVEVDGPSAAVVQTTAGRLGLPWAEAVFDSVDGVYDRYYPGSRAAISDLDLSFDNRPAALAMRSTDG